MSNAMVAKYEEDFVGTKDLREKCIDRVEILDKVKELFLIPKLFMMTTQQVADYFEVDQDAIKKCYQRNREEIDIDGTMLCKPDLWKGHYVPIKEKTRGMVGFNINDNIVWVSNAGIKMYPKRAILRIAMLLRDSPVAREIRTQLLNTFEHSTDEQKTADIDTEIDFVTEIGKAYMTGDLDTFAFASQKYIAFQNRHIEEITNNNKLLAGEILEWTDRSKMNKAVRILANKSDQHYGTVFNQLYDELRYKHGIGLSQRGGAPLLGHVRKDEWGTVLQSFSAICETSGFSPSKILERAKLQ